VKKNKIIIFLIILIFIDYSYLKAQNESIKIENFSYKEGLTSSGVNNVYKDTKGFLWLCTDMGLFRFDGYNFKNINTIANCSLKCETYCIIEDKKKNFWIGSAGKGVFYYNTQK
jgi:ligand-binding sensor domain-containing protein